MVELFNNIYISLPMISSLTCGMLFSIAYGQELTRAEHKAKKILIIYFAFMILSWFYAQLYPVYEDQLKYFIPLGCFLLQASQVFLYHFICILTPVKGADLFHIKFQYIIPLLLLLVSGIFMGSFVGIQQLSDNVISTFFMPYVYASTFFSVLIYTIAGSIRIYRYKKKLIRNYGIEKGRVTRWMELWMSLRGLFTLLSVFNGAWNINILWVMILLIPVQHIIIVYNMLVRNYMILSFNENHTVMISGGDIISMASGNDRYQAHLEISTPPILSKEELEQYYEKSKPYLNAAFKMNDLVEHFETNRTYLSGFINKTFGINFSQYNNLWRLKEVEYLRQKTENEDKNQEELALMAGFSNPRSYWRAKKFAEENYKKEDYGI